MRDAQTEQGEVPLLAPSNQNYGYVGKPAFKPVDCCGATPAWDAFWFVIPWESYARYGEPGGARGDLSGDAEVPGPVDSAVDRQGRRCLRPHPDRGPGRLGPAHGRPHDQRARFERLLRDTSRASRPTRRALSARRRSGTLRPAVREHPRGLQRAVPLGRRRLPREGHRPLRGDRADPAPGVRTRARRPPRGGRGTARRRHHEGARGPRLRRA